MPVDLPLVSARLLRAVRPAASDAVTGGTERSIETTDGIRLHVRDMGSGEPLLLVHGFTGSAESWGAAVLRRLSSGRRVIAVDLPGHGHSSAPLEAERYAIETVARDLTRVLDVLGLPDATWIGYSMGGRVALGAAVRSPQRVRRLVLESTSPGLPTDGERRQRREADESLASRIETWDVEEFVSFWTEQPLFATQRRLPEETREEQRRIRLGNRPTALAACLRGLGTGVQPSYWPRLRDLDLPVLVIAGSDDPKFAAIGARMGSALPDGTFTLVPGAGHAVHLEQPDKWLGTINAFLTR